MILLLRSCFSVLFYAKVINDAFAIKSAMKYIQCVFILNQTLLLKDEEFYLKKDPIPLLIFCTASIPLLSGSV